MRYRMLSVVVGLLPWSVLAAPDPTLMSLRQEIAALEVDHTLNLTHDQAVALLPMLQNAAAQVKARRDAMEQAKPALIATLTQARDELRSTGTISAATRQAMAAARAQAAGQGKQGFQDLRAQITQILTPDQRQALRSAPLGLGPNPSGEAKSSDAEGGPGHGKFGHRRFAIFRVLTSDAFLNLLQARAS